MADTNSSRAPDCVVRDPYMLILNAGLIQGPDGRYYADRSWAKDLLRHVAHFPNLVFVAPVRLAAPSALDEPIAADLVEIVPFPSNGGLRGFVRGLIGAAPTIVRRMRKVRVVHTSVAGKPFPIGWFTIPVARLLGKRIVVTVESSFWRVPAGMKVGLGRRAYAAFWEGMNRWCMRQVDYAAYQHENYRRTLPAPRAGGGVLYQASWIDAEQVVDQAEGEARRSRRRAGDGPLRLLFAARMVAEKGTGLLADVTGRLAARDVDIRIDIMGEGEERAALAEAAVATPWARHHVRMIDALPYGPVFLSALGDYDAVLVPNLADEQPRIVYDAGSQGVPAIVSDTPGLLSTVSDGETAIVIPRADPAALARVLIEIAEQPDRLAPLGEGARRRALATTHERMHEERCRDINEMLARQPDARPAPTRSDT